jgi:nicotinate-nucleotide adenylyltransferase
LGNAVPSKTDNDGQPLRLGLFGGTFNPIHRGHYQATVEILGAFDLDRIDLIPSALPPHKTESALATAEDRCEMVRLALQGHPRLLVSTVELERPGPSYTIDTLRYYQSVTPSGSRLFFILGVDAFLEIDTWKSYRQLLQQADLIVLSRPGVVGPADALEPILETFIQKKISPDFRWSADGKTLEHPAYHPIHPMRITPVEISSSRLRQMLRSGKDVSAWVAPPVLAYINKKGLYR